MTKAKRWLPLQQLIRKNDDEKKVLIIFDMVSLLHNESQKDVRKKSAYKYVKTQSITNS